MAGFSFAVVYREISMVAIFCGGAIGEHVSALCRGWNGMGLGVCTVSVGIFAFPIPKSNAYCIWFGAPLVSRDFAFVQKSHFFTAL